MHTVHEFRKKLSKSFSGLPPSRGNLENLGNWHFGILKTLSLLNEKNKNKRSRWCVGNHRLLNYFRTYIYYFRTPIGAKNLWDPSHLTAHSIHPLRPTEGRSESKIRLKIIIITLIFYKNNLFLAFTLFRWRNKNTTVFAFFKLRR